MSLPLRREEVLQLANAEGLTLRLGDSATGHYGVALNKPGQPRPYQARVSHSGSLGNFATAEEAALCVARSAKGCASSRQRAAVVAMSSAPALTEEKAVPLIPPYVFGKQQAVVPPEAFGEAALCEIALRVARSLEGHEGR